MDCARVDQELIGFQLAALDGATRAGVEAHLTGCSRCVSSFLALKRAMDAGEDATSPSEMLRARIRKEAEKSLSAVSPRAPATAPRPRRRLLAIAAAAAMLVAPLLYRATHAPAARVSAPATLEVVPVRSNETVDTARTTPENLAFL